MDGTCLEIQLKRAQRNLSQWLVMPNGLLGALMCMLGVLQQL